ncbi:Uncharacterised protein [Citrobacter braakii]|nr:Uncharacterised protein [Citrobacter braakii]
MMLRNVFRDAIENAGPRQHAKHGDHLAEVTRLPHACRSKRHRQQLHNQQTCTNFYQRTGRRP